MAVVNDDRDQPPSPESIEELTRRRRRQRWSAFLTPLIGLGSIVASVGLLMFFMKSCAERSPYNGPFSRGGARPPADAPPVNPQP